MNQLATTRDDEGKARVSITYAMSVGLALSFILIAAGVTKNDISYVFLAPIFLFAAPLAKSKYSTPRKIMICLSLGLTAFGTIKGYFVGNELSYILRFTAPLLAFSLACLFPGIGEALYRNRKLVMLMIFFHTIFVFYIVKTGDFLFAERFIPAWTLTFSSNAAISVWHYFAFPFCFIALTYILHRRFKAFDLMYIFLSLITLVALVLLTDTSSFILAIVMIALLCILPISLLKFSKLVAYVTLPLIILDFLTVKIISNVAVNLMYSLAIEDQGDVLRLIQIDYFVRYAEFFGSGFGAEHAFALETQFDRQISQIVYPYASELPTLNIIYNGGILAGIWFFWLTLIVIDLAMYRKMNAKTCTFGLGCSAILFGSISNPYLFAPASMLLLAIMFDIWDCTRADVKSAS